MTAVVSHSWGAPVAPSTGRRANALAERLEGHAVCHSYHHLPRLRAALASSAADGRIRS